MNIIIKTRRNAKKVLLPLLGFLLFAMPVGIWSGAFNNIFTTDDAYAATFSYDFEADTVGQAPANVTPGLGSSAIVVDGKALSPQTGSTGVGLTAHFEFDLFPQSTDHSVTWKENYTTPGRTGFILRAHGSATTIAGSRQGYLFQYNATTNDARVFRIDPTSFVMLGGGPAALTAPGAGVDRWYRATVEGSLLTMEYSTDGVTFTQIRQVTDSTYVNPGTTQLARGYNSPVTGTQIDDIQYVNNDSVEVNNVEDYRVFQRSSSNVANIPISGTYTGEPTAIEARFNGGPWATIDASPSGGTFSGVYANAAAGQGALEVRFVNSTTVLDTVNDVGVGDIFVIAGQSNAVGRGFNNQTYTHPTLKASLFGNDDNWKELVDPVDSNAGQIDSVSTDSVAAGTAWPLLATQIMASENVPVAFVPAAKGGSSALQWQPAVNNSDASTLYGSMNRRIAAVGGTVAGVLWFQGETDAIDATNAITYQTRIENIVDTLNVNFPGTKTIIGQIGHSTSPGKDTIRGAQIKTIADNPNALLGPATYDINLADEGGDTLHFRSNGDLQLFADRWFAAIDKELYGGTDGYGPILDSVIYNTAQNKVTATFTDESSPVIATDSTVAPSSFKLRNNGTLVAITSVAINGDTIEITPTTQLNPAQSITLTYASLNDAVDQAIYDSNDLPAQPFYNEAATVEFTVNFLDHDGATLNTQSVIDGGSAVAPANPTRTGYTFTGWSPSDFTNITAETNITAQYSAHQYTLMFNANGGSGTMANQAMTYDLAANLTANAFTRASATFNSWNTQADGGGTSYSDGQSVSNLTAADGGEVTLYAIWDLTAAAPTNLTATSGDAEVALSWTAPNDNGSAISDYVVEYKTSASGTWDTFADGTSTSTSATVTGLTNGTTYNFRVSAVNDGGTGPTSATATSTPAATPDTPTVSATALPAAASVSWSVASNGGATPVTYTLQIKQTSQDGSNWTTIVNNQAVTSFTATGLMVDTSYDFRVSATNPIGTTTYSTVASVTTQAVEETALFNDEMLTGGETISELPTFTGTANPGSTITVTVFSDPVICTTVADSFGNWSCTLPSSLPAGDHTVIVSVEYNNTTTEYGPFAVTVLADESTILVGSPNTGLPASNGVLFILAAAAGAAILAVGAALVRRNHNSLR